MGIIKFENEKTNKFVDIAYINENKYDNDFIFTRDIFNRCMIKLESFCSIDKIYNSEIIYYGNNFNITIEKFKELIIEECKRNIWFFFKYLFKIPSITGKAVMFEFNAGTYKFVEAYDNDMPLAFLYNPRQSCNSTILMGLYLYIHLFKPDCNLIIKCRDNASQERLDKTINQMMKLLPRFIFEYYNNYEYDDSINHTTYLFIDEYEYNNRCYISDYIFDLLRKENIRVFASSPINDDIPKDILKAINIHTDLVTDIHTNYNKPPLIMIPVDYILEKDTIEKLKYDLMYDEDLIRRELYRKRNG